MYQKRNINHFQASDSPVGTPVVVTDVFDVVEVVTAEEAAEL